ncbi:hypothetical protein CC79DRAFT_712096 [Sarocladium strictum]
MNQDWIRGLLLAKMLILRRCKIVCEISSKIPSVQDKLIIKIVCCIARGQLHHAGLLACSLVSHFSRTHSSNSLGKTLQDNLTKHDSKASCPILRHSLLQRRTTPPPPEKQHASCRPAVMHVIHRPHALPTNDLSFVPDGFIYQTFPMPPSPTHTNDGVLDPSSLETWGLLNLRQASLSEMRLAAETCRIKVL